MKKALIIGGSGTISAAVTRRIATDPGWEVYILNRGRRKDFTVPDNVRTILADITDERDTESKLAGMTFDCVCEFIAYTREDVRRDWRLFRGRTGQYIFISSASAYKKPADSHIITERTPLSNPYWKYSADKIACEEFLMEKYREEGFPVTIVRPSHTYDERKVPTAVHGRQGTWQIARRMMEGKQVIVHGDGSSLWTLTHNSDFAKGYTGLMGNPSAVGEAFHITSDESTSWDNIYRWIADALGVGYRPFYASSDFLSRSSTYPDLRGQLLGDKAVSVIFDNSKIKEFVPGFKAEISIREGLDATVKNILAHPEYQYEDPEFDRWCDNVIDILGKAGEQFSRF